MKAVEAPEKIHVQPNAHDRWFDGKIPSGLPNGLFVEYIRTDAFVKKAERYIRSVADGLDRDDDVETFISEFIKYMEGE